MAKQEAYVQYILDEMKRGNVERKTIMAKFVKKWQASERTFDRVWKVAQQKHAERANLARQKKDEQYIEMASKVEIGAIIDKARRMQIASEIAEGTVRDGSGKEPDFNARLKALDYLAKVEGDYAPVKSELTGKDGKAIEHSLTFDEKSVKDLSEMLDDKL